MDSLIIGIDGQIGSALNEVMTGNVLGTTIFPELLSDKCEILNLSGNISSWQPPSNIDVAYICAAICSIMECEENAEFARKVNIENTVLLAKKLVDSGAFVVFPSTNMIFDGLKPDYNENDFVCPLNEYGRQKAEAEKSLLEIGNCAIVRFTKIISPQTRLFNCWINELKKGNIINPFADMKIAPISLEYAVNIMKIIGEKKLEGIWHVASEEEITYEDAAKFIATEIGASTALIKPVSAKDKGIKNLLKYSTLNSNKIKNRLNLSFDKPLNVINNVLNL